MPQLVHHWTVAVFEYNVEHITELIVLFDFVSKHVGRIGQGKSLLRLMTASTDLSAKEHGLSQMQGIAIVQDAQRDVFITLAMLVGRAQPSRLCNPS